MSDHSDPLSKRQYFLALRDAYRDQIDYEGGLISNRVSWMVASQSFLLGTFASLINQPSEYINSRDLSAPWGSGTLMFNVANMLDHVFVLKSWFIFTGIMLSFITTISVPVGFVAIRELAQQFGSVKSKLEQDDRFVADDFLGPVILGNKWRRALGFSTTLVGPLFLIVWIGLYWFPSNPSKAFWLAVSLGVPALILWFFGVRWYYRGPE